jgi:hypothetical protein
MDFDGYDGYWWKLMDTDRYQWILKDTDGY